MLKDDHDTIEPSDGLACENFHSHFFRATRVRLKMQPSEDSRNQKQMKNRDMLVFNDSFIESILDDPEKPKNAVVDLNFSPERGRFVKFESLVRCRMISEYPGCPGDLPEW